MRLGLHCPLLVAALVAFAAPTHAGWFDWILKKAPQGPDVTEGLILPRLKQPNLMDRFRAYKFRRPEWFTANAMEQLKELAKRESDQVNRLSILHLAKGRSLGPVYIERTPQLFTAVQGLNLGTLRLRQINQNYFVKKPLSNAWDEIKKWYQEADAIIQLWEERIKELDAAASKLPERLKGSTGSTSAEGTEWVTLLQTISQNHKEDVQRVKQAMGWYRNQVELTPNSFKYKGFDLNAKPTSEEPVVQASAPSTSIPPSSPNIAGTVP
ncbi:hypothetical protein ACQY0O_005558 [Thecaphora frezii]